METLQERLQSEARDKAEDYLYDTKKHLDSNYKQWSRSVKIRDHWKCKLADSHCAGRLEAHHIFGWKDYPEKRYEINNGITLCQFHHPLGQRAVEMRISFLEILGV